jgi:glyoxylase-like metal-dependent hydrolase (beta-lactamase superfamily II)
MLKLNFPVLITAFGFVFLQVSAAQQPDPDLKTIKVADNIYMLQGNGGNIGVMTGEDGVFMIDDQFAASNPAIMAAIAKISDKAVKFLVNTHWHPDHTGGNELLGKAGSIIVAQDNVRKTLSGEQFTEYFNRTSEPLSKEGLPVITFADAVTFHYNGDDIYVAHTPPAHTDGDAAVFFKNANVVHAGDVVTVGRYPFIDYQRGGSAEGYIAAVRKLIDTVDDNTKIIPGHGPLCDRKYLGQFHDMLAAVTGRIKGMKDTGSALEEIVASKPTAEFDANYAGSVKPDDFVTLVYKNLK